MDMGGSQNLGYPFGGILRTIVFWGPNWGSIILGNYHIPILPGISPREMLSWPRDRALLGSL